MVAYDSPYGVTPSAGKRSRAAGSEPVAPAADYALTPDQHGKITLAGKKIPLGLALIGAGVAAALLINQRTRGPVIAAATTAWGFLGRKAA